MIKFRTTRAILAGMLAVAVFHPATTIAAEWAVSEGDDWRPVDLSRAAVEPGSVLDVGRLVEAPAGKHGRVVLDSQGKMVFEKSPEKRIIFFGCSVGPEQVLGRARSKEDIQRWAESVRRQGYNLVRPHFLDHYLTRDSKQDIQFDPEALDRFDYLVACLKQNGIYLYLDAMTSWRGYKAGPGWSAESRTEAFKSRIFGDASTREHWKQGVGKLLCHTNAYTQTRLVDDPVVAVVLFFNEQNLNFYQPVHTNMAGPWRDWLKRKYGSMEALRAAWSEGLGKESEQIKVTFETLPLFEPRDVWKDNAKGRDVGLFVYDSHAELLDWYTHAICGMGYRGLITQYDWLYNLGVQALRNRVPVLSMHGYHGHPSDFVSPGSRVDQSSAVESANGVFCSMAGTRYGNRPLLITEYGQVFWNQHRYEEGLLVGGYAALQDLDGLMAHANPVLNSARSPILPFSIALDPIARASQVVAGYCYLRRDVAPSPHYVELTLQKNRIFDHGQHAHAISKQQSALALITGIGLNYADEPPPEGLCARSADLKLPAAYHGQGCGSRTL